MPQPQKQRKIPERRCVGCGIGYPKRDLIRIVRSPDGGEGSAVSLDFTGKKSGRGVYICRNLACFRRARKAGHLSRNLSSEELHVTIPEELLDAIERQLVESGAPTILPKKPQKEEPPAEK